MCLNAAEAHWSVPAAGSWACWESQPQRRSRLRLRLAQSDRNAKNVRAAMNVRNVKSVLNATSARNAMHALLAVKIARAGTTTTTATAS